jgi:NifU-like protein involved in Fe-S cluster formation
MWKYSKKLMDHFMNPRNSGQLMDPDGHSEVGSVQCGDAMTLDINVDDEGRIEDIRFMTFGCAGAIAAASALTEIARGKTLEQALGISNDEIVDYLGGMPDEKYHCSVMGHEALEEAVKDFQRNRDRMAENLQAIIEDPPEELRDSLEGEDVEVLQVHPRRVSLRIGEGNQEAGDILEEELGKRSGKKVEVRIIR